MFWKSLDEHSRPQGMQGAKACWSNEEGYILTLWDHEKFRGWILYDVARRFYSRRAVLNDKLSPVTAWAPEAQAQAESHLQRMHAMSH